jgi:SAM-dependent methyltransferase
LFSRFVRFFRVHFRSRAVRSAFIKYFPVKGTFVEAGSGTSQTSLRIPREGRKLIAGDYAFTPLKIARNFVDWRICCDIRKLPFSKESIDGIWNLGVMEHYVEREQIKILKEFHCVLKPKGRVVLFWPPPVGSDKVVLDTVSCIFSIFGKKKKFFPDEPGRITKYQAKKVLYAAGFEVIDVYFPLWDFFTEMVLVGEKR